MRTKIILLFFSLTALAFSQTEPQNIYLWENGAPGFEDRKDEPEQAKDYWVKNIHNPSITAFLPPEDKATGAAVLIAPGGGHRMVVVTAEGWEAAHYLNSIGVAAFVLKYRLGREENSPYDLEKHTRQDAQRALRLIRSKADAFNIDPNRLGMLGFSAGGEVVNFVAYENGAGDPDAKDLIDRLNARPDFHILVYPGPLGVPEVVSPTAPPVFMIAANDDACCSGPVVTLLQKYREAGVPVEAHIYANGDHAFNMGNRSDYLSLQAWPERMKEWLIDSGWLTPKEE